MDGDSLEPNLQDHLKSLAENFEQRACDEFGIAPGQHNVSIADVTVDEEWVGVGSAFMVALNREKNLDLI